MYMPTYAEALELKKYLADRKLEYVHFHDQCVIQFFSFDRYDEESARAAERFWLEKGLHVSFTGDGLRFIVTED